MKTGKGNQAEEAKDDEEFCARKDATGRTNNAEDGKKANATRSKHWITEHDQRNKINDRFQILIELIPSSDEKRDTASVSLEVIQYVIGDHDRPFFLLAYYILLLSLRKTYTLLVYEE
ncbi:unnamed protein product [Fraxinus pennsylvanica]|uniref:BHLH domain-containing protein n=1 Tax=Fraxinus pennsylvanica TaxID=56036 RepID=A0AAD2A619_9LAMI|nr:unnamed protein product [Fraxinus pennsylvanica]